MATFTFTIADATLVAHAQAILKHEPLDDTWVPRRLPIEGWNEQTHEEKKAAWDAMTQQQKIRWWLDHLVKRHWLWMVNKGRRRLAEAGITPADEEEIE